MRRGGTKQGRLLIVSCEFYTNSPTGAAAPADSDALERSRLEPLHDGLLTDSERESGFLQTEPAFGRVRCRQPPDSRRCELDPPGGTGSELGALEETTVDPADDGGPVDAQHRGRLLRSMDVVAHPRDDRSVRDLVVVPRHPHAVGVEGQALGRPDPFPVQDACDLRVGKLARERPEQVDQLPGRDVAMESGSAFREFEMGALATAPVDVGLQRGRPPAGRDDDVLDQQPDNAFAILRPRRGRVPERGQMLGVPAQAFLVAGAQGALQTPEVYGRFLLDRLHGVQRRLEAALELSGHEPVGGIDRVVLTASELHLVACPFDALVPVHALTVARLDVGPRRRNHAFHAQGLQRVEHQALDGTLEPQATKTLTHRPAGLPPCARTRKAQRARPPAVAHAHRTPTLAAEHLSLQQGPAGARGPRPGRAVAIGLDLALIALKLLPRDVPLMVILDQHGPILPGALADALDR